MGGWLEITILMKTQSSTLFSTLDSNLGFVNKDEIQICIFWMISEINRPKLVEVRLQQAGLDRINNINDGEMDFCF